MSKLLTILIPLSGLLFACSSTPETAPVATFDPEPWLEKGGRVQGASFAVLSTKLNAAMAEHGIAGAVQFCNQAAYPLTDTLSKMYDCSIRRVSLHPRNPLNQANEFEFAILENWEKDVKNNVDPVAVVQELAPDTIMYYGPIRIQQGCLNCHGKIETEIATEVRSRLTELYPDDRATGYALGDLRGMWSIRFVNR